MKAYIFDYGGTIDTGGCHWSEVILRNYHRAGIDVEREAFRHAYVEGERYLDRTDCIRPSDTMLDMLRKKIDYQFEVLGLKEGAEAVAMGCYEEARATTADAATTLATLAETYPLYMVSNFYGNLKSVLADFGLLKFFRHVTESALEGVRKPDPELYRRGIAATGFMPQDIMVVGDSFGKDIMPAHTLGCQTAWVKGIEWEPKQHDESIPTRIISNIRELL